MLRHEMPRRRRRLALTKRRGFTLIEAITATAIMGIAASTLLIGLASNAETTRDSLERVIAQGLARQLLDEVLGMKYSETPDTPYDNPMGPGSPEISAGARRQFDDIDDYNGIRTTPVTDRWGVTLGNDDGKGGSRYANFQAPTGFFTGWKQQVDVYYVSETNLSTPLSSGASNYRMIDVRIQVTQADGSVRELARATRVAAYVPNQ